MCGNSALWKKEHVKTVIKSNSSKPWNFSLFAFSMKVVNTPLAVASSMITVPKSANAVPELFCISIFVAVVNAHWRTKDKFRF